MRKALSGLVKAYSYQSKQSLSDLGIKVRNGKKFIDCGPITNCRVVDLLSYATPSVFGKGSETVFDENVRKGKEIKAEDIIFYCRTRNSKTEDSVVVSKFLQSILQKTMPSSVFHHNYTPELKFCKLAMYEVGGHFLPHKDTTHADNHIATLLIEVPSEHTGGDLVLRMQDQEQRWSLVKTKTLDGLSDEDDDDDKVNCCMFYTDVNHQVEPVLSGVRAVLQFDVLVPSKYLETEDMKNQGEESAEDNSYDDDEEEENERIEDGAHFFEIIKPLTVNALFVENNNSTTKMTLILQEMAKHVTDSASIALPLAHEYRVTGIVPQYLKCQDALLFHAFLQAGYHVALTPVELEVIGIMNNSGDRTGYEYSVRPYDYDNIVGYSFPSSTTPITMTMAFDNLQTERITKYKQPPGIVYVVTTCTGAIATHSQSAIEYTGNESQPSEDRYFSGAMIVYKTLKEMGKNDAKKRRTDYYY